MTVSPQSLVSLPRRRSKRAPMSANSNQDPTRVSSLKKGVVPKNGHPKLEQLPKARPIPIWLRSLLIVQRSSHVLTFLLIAITLGIYAWTVYTQKQWSTQYRKLETLQRHERHFTATNELMKNQLAQEAERPEMGLLPPNPANNIFLPPVKPRPPLVKPTPPTTTPIQNIPLGY